MLSSESFSSFQSRDSYFPAPVASGTHFRKYAKFALLSMKQRIFSVAVRKLCGFPSDQIGKAAYAVISLTEGSGDCLLNAADRDPASPLDVPKTKTRRVSRFDAKRN